MRPKHTLNAGDVYAFTSTQDAGFFIVLVEFNSGNSKSVGCVSLPDMQNCTYTAEELFLLHDTNVIELVDNLPDDVFLACKEHYCTQSELLSQSVVDIFTKDIDLENYEITLEVEGE